MEKPFYPEFKTYRLNNRGSGSAREISIAFDDLLGMLSTHVPLGREFSIVRTKLEEACFFAKKGVATDPRNQLED